ncbi:NAD(P)/FAD-dependent oxidoreductase [Capnocytophaga sp.]|uniref:NAD(P)/FAD-dependent oxidoreductase n=1 Tax=Capnocytophaga sp. TaxID=44737 RepID=UPI0026DAD2EB|nr:NAD(P)/FAD-dependent oxidoreductase [Capnocytophaga sp.]MDO5104393.1 NAD(P)/FAD-dependent oxidoreductase [Capnocytophaga sp.]
MFDVLIIGAGAAGFFTAINCAEKNPRLKIALLEKGKEVLSKVRISGGGRCNLTHAEYLPKQLVRNYPRGEKELLSPFHRFMCGDVMEWFENRGVPLKVEDDGRVFPQSNTSESIISCFLSKAKQHNIQILREQNATNLKKHTEYWEVFTQSSVFTTKKLVIATGSNPKIWQLLAKLGHTIVPPVPSLFTFNTADPFIENLAGVSVAWAEASLADTDGNALKLKNLAPLLITHWGFSGPAILKLSAFAARVLAERSYQCCLLINWLADSDGVLNQEEAFVLLQQTKQEQPRKGVQNTALYNLPKRLWVRLLERAGVNPNQVWAELNKAQLRALAKELTVCEFRIDGKSVFKEEFVTAGGVALSEINFKTFESKLFSDLFLAGEVIDVDAVTGGFNFQNAWTGAYIIAETIAETTLLNP